MSATNYACIIVMRKGTHTILDRRCSARVLALLHGMYFWQAVITFLILDGINTYDITYATLCTHKDVFKVIIYKLT